MHEEKLQEMRGNAATREHGGWGSVKEQRSSSFFSSGSREVIGNNAINSRTLGERKGRGGFFPSALSFLGDTNRCRITDTVFKRDSLIPLHRRSDRSRRALDAIHSRKGARFSRGRIDRNALGPHDEFASDRTNRISGPNRSTLRHPSGFLRTDKRVLAFCAGATIRARIARPCLAGPISWEHPPRILSGIERFEPSALVSFNFLEMERTLIRFHATMLGLIREQRGVLESITSLYNGTNVERKRTSRDETETFEIE